MATWPNKVGSFWVNKSAVNYPKLVPDGKSMLEIGTFDGVLISIMAERNPNKNFVSVDAFMKAAHTTAGTKAHVIANTKHLKNHILYEGKSCDVLPTLNQKFTLIFIDGGHEYETVKQDIKDSIRLLDEPGYISFHDYPHVPEVKKAVDEFLKEYKTKKIPNIVDRMPIFQVLGKK